MSRWRCDIERQRLINRQALYITVDSDTYLSIFIAATNRFARTLSIAIVVINRLGPPSIDSHWRHQCIREDIDRYIWSASIYFGVAPQHTPAQTIVRETGSSIDTTDDKHIDRWPLRTVIPASTGANSNATARDAVYCPGCALYHPRVPRYVTALKGLFHTSGNLVWNVNYVT